MGFNVATTGELGSLDLLVLRSPFEISRFDDRCSPSEGLVAMEVPPEKELGHVLYHGWKVLCSFDVRLCCRFLYVYLDTPFVA